MNELALFAGAGGGILGGHLLGWRTVCAVEWEPYPASVLCARQNDGLLPPFPVWDDVQTFDGKPWRGIVDVVSGGFPCQDISAAGKGAGIDGERSGMWREMARIIHEVRPRFVFVENSPMLTSRGLGRVLGDLAEMGFDAKWGVLGAADVGAPHQRDRIWIVGKMANSTKLQCNGGNDNTGEFMVGESISEFGNGDGSQIVADTIGVQKHGIRGIGEQGRDTLGWDKQTTQQNNGETSSVSFSRCGESAFNVANTSLSRFETRNNPTSRPELHLLEKQFGRGCNEFRAATNHWEVEPNVGRVVDGMAARVDRLKAIGNGQVSEVARRAWEILSDL